MAQSALAPAEIRNNSLVILDVLARFCKVGTPRGLRKSTIGAGVEGTALILTC